MDTITCHESSCKNEIDPETMDYGKDYYVLINLSEVSHDEINCVDDILDRDLVGIYCKNCGTIILAEAAANGFEIVSRRN